MSYEEYCFESNQISMIAARGNDEEAQRKQEVLDKLYYGDNNT